MSTNNFTDRKGDWIQMQNGKPFWPLDPRLDEITIEDIAHSLSLQCRWNGHCREFYSVAQHCVLVAQEAQEIEPRAALWGLMHDATEAYLTDVPRPLKPLLKGYKEAEDNLALAIIDKFNIPFDEAIADAVHQADGIQLFLERNELLDDPVIPWGDPQYHEANNIHTKLSDEYEDFYCWEPKTAAWRFMEEFNFMTFVEKQTQFKA